MADTTETDHDDETDETRDVWQLCEEAPTWATETADLYHWSTNYDAGKGPFTLFLDLIGWTADEIGGALYDLERVPEQLGYLELSKLADALNEYADRPTDVRGFVDSLMEAEGRS